MMTMRVYDAKEVAGFNVVRGPLSALVNFSQVYPLDVPLESGVVRIDSSETLYQIAKFHHREDLQRQLFQAANAHENGPRGGKDFAISHKSEQAPDWAQGRSIQSMRYALRLKTAQHRDEVLAAFKHANGRPLVEISRKDDFWGAKPCPDGTLRGENILGRLWMEIRAEIEANPDAHRYTVPCYDTTLFGETIKPWVRPMTVLNAHAVGTEADGAVYVGRPSKWGNPIKVSEKTPRGEALKEYLTYLKNNPQIVEQARQELAGRDLICWCAPRACHAGVLGHVAAGNPVPESWSVPEKSKDKDPEIEQGSFMF